MAAVSCLPDALMTWRYRHGVSDPIRHGASYAEHRAAMVQAEERDAAVTAVHQPPAEFPDCRVCNTDSVAPPVRRPARWRVVLRRILWGVQ